MGWPKGSRFGRFAVISGHCVDLLRGPSLNDLDRQRDGLAAADAAGDSTTAARLLQTVEQGRRNRTPLHPIGWPSDRTAVDVDLLGGDRQLVFGRHRHGREGFTVDLEKVSIGDRPANLFAEVFSITASEVVNHSGSWRNVAEPTILASGLSKSTHASIEATSKAAAPSLMLEAFPAVIVPLGTERPV